MIFKTLYYVVDLVLINIKVSETSLLMSKESVYPHLLDGFSHLIDTESVDVIILEDRATLWVVGGKEGAWSSDTEPLEVSTILSWSQSESNIARSQPIR